MLKSVQSVKLCIIVLPQCQRNHWQKDHKNHSVLVSAVILRKEGALEPFASLNDCPFKHDPEGQGRNKRKK